MTSQDRGKVVGLDGAPEGSEAARRRVPRYAWPLAFLFALYLIFRLGQGIVWLSHHL